MSSTLKQAAQSKSSSTDFEYINAYLSAMETVITKSVVSVSKHCVTAPGHAEACRSQTSQGGLRLHMSTKQITTLREGTNSRPAYLRVRHASLHASGFWYAFDAEWINLRSGMHVQQFAYDVHLKSDCLTSDINDTDKNKKVLVLRDWNDVLAFHEKYMIGLPWDHEDQWAKVKKDFAGYEIRFAPPRMYDVIVSMMEKLYSNGNNTSGRFFSARVKHLNEVLDAKSLPYHMYWLHDMDIRSGCIWNLHHVVSDMYPLPLLASLLPGYEDPTLYPMSNSDGED